MKKEQNNLIVLGAGGHAGVLMDIITSSGQFNILGILDPQLETGSTFLGTSVLGTDDLLPELYAKGHRYAAIGIGGIKDNNKRDKLYNELRKMGFSVPALIHPQAIVSKQGVVVSEGVQVMAGAIIQVNTFIDENTVINTGAIIDHDCRIGKHVFISPGVTVSGGVCIGNNSFIGAGATIIQGVVIGKNSVVAAGAVVIADVPDGALVKGVPAK